MGFWILALGSEGHFLLSSGGSFCYFIHVENQRTNRFVKPRADAL
jgi:hypothetical protein